MTPMRTTRSPRRRRAMTAISPPRASTTTSATRRWATLMVAAWPDGSENPLPQSGQLVQPAPELVSTTKAPLMATTYVATTAVTATPLIDGASAAERLGLRAAVPTVQATTAT